MDQFREGLGDAWESVARFVPKLIGFLLVLLVGYFIAKAIERVVDAVLERIGLDRWVERGGVGKVLARSRFDASSLLARIAFYIVLLFVLQLAFGVFGANPVSALLASVIAYLPKVFAALLIVVIGAAIAAAVKEIVESALGGLSYGRTLAVAAGVVVLGIALFAALDQLEIAPTIVTGLFYALLLVAVGPLIIAVGFGGIPVARRYLERAAERADGELQRARQEAVGARERIQERLREAAPGAAPALGARTEAPRGAGAGAVSAGLAGGARPRTPAPRPPYAAPPRPRYGPGFTTPETKPFYKTSEFFAALLAGAGLLLATLFTEDVDAIRALALGGLLLVGYMISRGIAKAGSRRA